ncbi:MAG: TVP38/TMEM64 family protein [Ornithinimicrobium sp.]|uniref:TVP38/TMEM64 family protein n=1 Tax=Ornithinimicrobium sp. TaxID=1977084 RepID=UPI0026E0AEAF|nr:TVP38/TMEM64 family protein [Ornithinimicrobium sp.]MDO5740202.1 TVP38/TMEM64 family protein [Ornithinimicrobium sp.]
MRDRQRVRGVWVRVALLVGLFAGLFLVDRVWGWPDVSSLQRRVEESGTAGVLIFVLGYVLLSLLPAPKAVLTALGGMLYGLWLGALLSWFAALVGAVMAFGLGRLLGRDAVDRLIRGRLDRADRLLADHGVGAVIVARLVPILPFTAINYAGGLTGVRLRDFMVGSALGMVPGSLAYAALGASGTDPWGIFIALAALVALVVVGGLVGQRVLSASAPTAGSDQDKDED